MNNIDSLDNYQLSEAIDKYVRGEKARKVLKRKLIDCITFEKISEEFDMSDRQIKNIYKKSYQQLFSKL